jgi:hypothetical protein
MAEAEEDEMRSVEAAGTKNKYVSSTIGSYRTLMTVMETTLSFE